MTKGSRRGDFCPRDCPYDCPCTVPTIVPAPRQDLVFWANASQVARPGQLTEGEEFGPKNAIATDRAVRSTNVARVLQKDRDQASGANR